MLVRLDKINFHITREISLCWFLRGLKFFSFRMQMIYGGNYSRHRHVENRELVISWWGSEPHDERDTSKGERTKAIVIILFHPWAREYGNEKLVKIIFFTMKRDSVSWRKPDTSALKLVTHDGKFLFIKVLQTKSCKRNLKNSPKSQRFWRRRMMVNV